MSRPTRRRFFAVSSDVESNAQRTNYRVSLPKEVREGLNWGCRFERGFRTLFWYDPMFDETTAVITSINDERIERLLELYSHYQGIGTEL